MVFWLFGEIAHPKVCKLCHIQIKFSMLLNSDKPMDQSLGIEPPVDMSSFVHFRIGFSFQPWILSSVVFSKNKVTSWPTFPSSAALDPNDAPSPSLCHSQSLSQREERPSFSSPAQTRFQIFIFINFLHNDGVNSANSLCHLEKITVSGVGCLNLDN